MFGAANGTADLAELLARMGQLSQRSGKGPIDVDTWIGCLAINEPVFFPPDEWVRVPADWSREIVSGKGYDLATCDGLKPSKRSLVSSGRSESARKSTMARRS